MSFTHYGDLRSAKLLKKDQMLVKKIKTGTRKKCCPHLYLTLNCVKTSKPF